jgi:hypothetical protein
MNTKLVHLTKVGPTGDIYVMRPFHLPHTPDNSLPGEPGHPDNTLPQIPGVPDNTLPTTPPPTVPAGMVVVMVRTSDGKWHWAAMPAPNVPTPLPEPPPVAQPKG